MLTNIYPLRLPFEEFQLRRVPYQDGLLNELRRKHNETHSFFRAQDFIYVAHMQGADLTLGDQVSLKVNESEVVVSSLIKHLLFRTFRSNFPNYLPQDFYPLRFFSQKKDEDLIANLLPVQLQGVISLRKLIEIYLRSVKINGKMSFCLVPTVRYRWLFSSNLKTLISEGYDVVGKPVIEAHAIPGLEKVLAPDETLVGLVKRVENGKAIIGTNNGEAYYDTDQLYLRKSKQEIGAYLSHKLGSYKTNELFKTLRSRDEMRFHPNNLYKETNQIMRLLSTKEFRSADNFCFEIPADGVLPDNDLRLEETKFIFGNAPTYPEERPLKGLDLLGPSDSAVFDNKSPHILVICRPANRGKVSEFLGKLRDGMPDSQYYKKGLKVLFRLQDVTFDIHEVSGDAAEDYEVAVKQAIEANFNRKYDLAIIEGSQAQKLLAPAVNPYIRVKAALMNLGIPVQFITDETFRDLDRFVQFKLGPLALQIYAKLGGVPWVLPIGQNVDREIIVGVGNALIRPNAYVDAEVSRIVGITTFFSGDGRYLLGQQLKDVPYNEYFDELLKNLKGAIASISKEYGWKDTETIRIVFHIFKPIKNIEAEVVQKLVSEYSQHRIIFAFVTISDEHPFMLFRTQRDRQGLHAGEPERRDNLVIDELSCIVQLRGAKERVTKKHKFSNPVLVKIHPGSTYRDLFYITQQILNLTKMSWRGFLPSEKPVTLYYADLMASLSGKLRQVKGWNPQVITQHFKSKRWFL